MLFETGLCDRFVWISPWRRNSILKQGKDLTLPGWQSFSFLQLRCRGLITSLKIKQNFHNKMRRSLQLLPTHSSSPVCLCFFFPFSRLSPFSSNKDLGWEIELGHHRNHPLWKVLRKNYTACTVFKGCGSWGVARCPNIKLEVADGECGRLSGEQLGFICCTATAFLVWI